MEVRGRCINTGQAGPPWLPGWRGTVQGPPFLPCLWDTGRHARDSASSLCPVPRPGPQPTCWRAGPGGNVHRGSCEQPRKREAETGPCFSPCHPGSVLCAGSLLKSLEEALKRCPLRVCGNSSGSSAAQPGPTCPWRPLGRAGRGGWRRGWMELPP